VVGAAAMFHTGAWAGTATAVSRACHLALFQPSQLLHLCLRAPSLGRKLLCVLGYHALLGQREYGFCDDGVRGGGGGGGGGGGEMLGAVAEVRGARRRALLSNIFAEDAPLRNDKLGGDAHVRMLGEHVRCVEVAAGAELFSVGKQAWGGGVGLYAAARVRQSCLVFVLAGAVVSTRDGAQQRCVFGPTPGLAVTIRPRLGRNPLALRHRELKSRTSINLSKGAPRSSAAVNDQNSRGDPGSASVG